MLLKVDCNVLVWFTLTLVVSSSSSLRAAEIRKRLFFVLGAHTHTHTRTSNCVLYFRLPCVWLAVSITLASISGCVLYFERLFVWWYHFVLMRGVCIFTNKRIFTLSHDLTGCVRECKFNVGSCFISIFIVSDMRSRFVCVYCCLSLAFCHYFDVAECVCVCYCVRWSFVKGDCCRHRVCGVQPLRIKQMLRKCKLDSEMLWRYSHSSRQPRWSVLLLHVAVWLLRHSGGC